jgi:hypothetical protein
MSGSIDAGWRRTPKGKHVISFVDAGYGHVYVHPIGPAHDGFFDFYRRDAELF